MLRSTVIAAIHAYLSAAYNGPVSIHPETGSGELVPPYAVIRIGSGEQMFPGQAEIWDINILIGVFHDADVTPAATAEAQAAAVFALLADPEPLFTASQSLLVWSAMERTGTDASISESRWQHVAVFRGIASPAA